VKKIPLRARDGTVRAYALVDDEDYETVSTHRWYLGRNGYVMRGHTVYLHREILGLVNGDGRQGDHKNNDRLDNRRSNLRAGTNALNQQNRRGAQRNSTSGIRGAHFHTASGLWLARVTVAGITHTFGYHDTPVAAGEAAARGRATLMPWAKEAA
jgi:hypothetical protein